MHVRKTCCSQNHFLPYIMSSECDATTPDIITTPTEGSIPRLLHLQSFNVHYTGLVHFILDAAACLYHKAYREDSSFSSLCSNDAIKLVRVKVFEGWMAVVRQEAELLNMSFMLCFVNTTTH